jgi:hypothetical protein
MGPSETEHKKKLKTGGDFFCEQGEPGPSWDLFSPLDPLCCGYQPFISLWGIFKSSEMPMFCRLAQPQRPKPLKLFVLGVEFWFMI